MMHRLTFDRQTMCVGGGYPVRPPVTCIDISHVAENTLNFQVGWVSGGFPVQMVRFYDSRLKLDRFKGGRSFFQVHLLPL